MSLPAFCYQNHLETAGITITASSEETDFPKENAYDWRTDDWWKPTSAATSTLTADMGAGVDADYAMIFAHDLHTQGATIKFQHSTDNFGSDVQTVFTKTPTTSAPIIVPFTSVNKRYWRFEISGASAAQSIGVLAFGERLDSPEDLRNGFAPPNFARVPELLTNRAEAGAFIGRRIKRKGVKFTINLTLLDPAFIRDSWEDFQDHYESKPFGLVWNYDDYPDEAVYCWTEGTAPAPAYTHAMAMTAGLPLRGLIL